MTSHEETTAPPANDVPEKKQTALGLYVTSLEAYEMWKADPDSVTIVDVRTPEEYIFVGHAPMARNVPHRLHHVPVGCRGRTSPPSSSTPSSSRA